jgi:F-type H+-transporting ATPase subunit gamma
VQTVTADFDSGLIFEQDPVQIIDALLPLYLNATLLRALQVPDPALAQSMPS